MSGLGNDRRLRRQFESDADIAAAIDSIMAGKFDGVVSNEHLHYSAFTKLGVFPLGAHLPDFVPPARPGPFLTNKFMHPGYVLAAQVNSSVEQDPLPVILDREMLAKMFQKGFVIAGGEGEKLKAQFRATLPNNSLPLAFHRRTLAILRSQALAAASEDVRPLMEQVFDHVEQQGIEVDTKMMREIAAMDMEALGTLIERMRSGEGFSVDSRTSISP